MTALSGRSRADEGVARRTVVLLALALGLAVGSVMFAAVLQRYPPPWIAVVGSVGLVAMLMVAIARYEAAVAIGLLLLGVVAVEPAPPDGVFAIVIAVALVTGRFRIDRAPISVVALSMFYMLLNIASTVDAVSASRAALFAAVTLYLVIFALWLTGWLDSEHKARLVVRWYLVGAVIASLATTLAILTHFPGSDPLLTSDLLRGKGLFKDPNVFGPFLVPIALILIEELLNPRLLRLRPSLKAVALLILMAGMFFSYSRGALLNFGAAVMVMLLVLAVRRGGGRRAAMLLTVIVLGGAGIVGVAATTGQLTFFQERAKTQGYDRDRFAAQRQGIEYGETHLVGIGPGQFELLQVTPSHNLYVRALSEQGFLGFFTIVALVIATLILAVRNALLGRDTYGIGSAALLAAWAGIAVESFFIDTLHWRHLWLVAALVWIGSKRGDTVDDRPATTVHREAMTASA
ncbi:MAG TPA: O-antigen ligase family protein [Thermoleophilaceae bacterium]|nr:O-antigen ligase family protein [Thermoleophilaceae bacterium]